MNPLIVLGLACLGYSKFKEERRSADVRYGIDREPIIGGELRRRGASVWLSPGSRGAADLIASWSGTTWYIQSKASRRGSPKWPGSKEIQRLVNRSRGKGRPIVALTEDDFTEYYCAKTGEQVYPPRSR